MYVFRDRTPDADFSFGSIPISTDHPRRRDEPPVSEPDQDRHKHGTRLRHRRRETRNNK